MVYKAAIIGCGKIGSEYSEDPLITGIYSHAEAYSVSRDIELAAVCDTDIKKQKKCQERWNVHSAYSDYREMMEKIKPDIVSICTPDPSHYPLISTILKETNVRAIIAEKPLATTMDNAKKIVSLAQKNNVVLTVNYPRRYADNHQTVRDQIQKQKSIGIIQMVSGFYSKGIIHSGTHWFDLARFLIGEISSVRGMNTLQEKSDDPTLDAYIQFECGVSGFLHGCDENAFSIFEMDIIGTTGRIQILDQGNTVHYYRVAGDPNYSGYKALFLEKTDRKGLGDVLLNAVNDVVSCLDKGTQPLCSGEDGVQALAISLAIRSSAHRNREVRLK
jgi:predicted dehydrogenase